jgi:hypothetical protein
LKFCHMTELFTLDLYFSRTWLRIKNMWSIFSYKTACLWGHVNFFLYFPLSSIYFALAVFSLKYYKPMERK